MAERIWLETDLPHEFVNFLIGRPPDPRHFDQVASRAGVWLKPDGSPLLCYQPGALVGSEALMRFARPALLRAAKPTNRRPVAAGDAEKFHSGIVGFYRREPTAFMVENRAGFLRMVPLIRRLDELFREHLPEQHEVLRAAADRAPDCRLADTAFTTVTANYDARTMYHRDDGNLSGALGVLAVDLLWPDSFSGGLLVFPRFRIAVDLRPGDLLIADNREVHGNTEFRGRGRVTAVPYFHESNLPPP